MEYQQLGTSELRVSRVSFGCMSLRPGQTDATAILHRALAGGINLFDTADLYDQGQNETLVGRAFKEKRSEVVIATKVGNQLRPDGSGWDWNPRKAYILSAVEESLRRLQTDYIDLYQLHGGTIDDPIDETIAAFELLQQQGKIRYYGISSIRPNVIREYVQRSKIVSVMMQYSLLDRRPEEECLDLLKTHGIGVLARGSVASGLLVNKPAKPYLEHTDAAVQAVANAVQGLAATGRDAAQVAMGFVLANPAIASTVVGVRTEEQLNDALQAFDGPKLLTEELAQLRNAAPAITYAQHR